MRVLTLTVLAVVVCLAIAQNPEGGQNRLLGAQNREKGAADNHKGHGGEQEGANNHKTNEGGRKEGPHPNPEHLIREIDDYIEVLNGSLAQCGSEGSVALSSLLPEKFAKKILERFNNNWSEASDKINEILKKKLEKFPNLPDEIRQHFRDVLGQRILRLDNCVNVKQFGELILEVANRRMKIFVDSLLKGKLEDFLTEKLERVYEFLQHDKQENQEGQGREQHNKQENHEGQGREQHNKHENGQGQGREQQHNKQENGQGQGREQQHNKQENGQGQGRDQRKEEGNQETAAGQNRRKEKQ